MSKTKQRKVSEQRGRAAMYLKGMQDYVAYENKVDDDSDELWSKVGERSPHWNNMAYRSGWFRFKA